MSGEKRLTWRGKTILAVLSPLVFLGLLEIGLRIGGFRYEPWKARLEGKSHEELGIQDVYEPHPDLIWTLRRSTVLQTPDLGFAGVATNSHGLRGRPLPGAKGPDDLRVLCLGDSVTFCLGLDEEDTWPVRMEEALKEIPELSGRSVRVVNGAVPGYSSVQGMRLFDLLDGLEPDVVVFWFGLPDSHDMRELPDSMQTLPVGGLPKVLAALWKLRGFQLIQKFMIAVRSSTTEGTRVSRAEFRANVDRLLEMERSGGPRVLFVREPERCDTTITQLQAVVTMAEEVGAERIVAPRRLLAWIMPVPAGAKLPGRKILVKGRPALYIRPDPRFPGCETSDTVVTLEKFREDLVALKRHKRLLDSMLAQLPKDALTYKDLFGRAGPDAVFTDNCHLTPLGASLAGRVLARKAFEKLSDRQ